MAQAKKINALTEWFLLQYDKLKTAGKIPLDKELAKIMGFEKPNGLSNILSRHYNLKPDKLDKFCKHFKIQKPSDFSVSTGNTDNLVYSEPISVREYIDKINQHGEYLQGLLALSLNDLSRDQKDMYSHLMGAIKRQAERFAEGSSEILQDELDKISTYALEYRGIHFRKGSPAGEDNVEKP